MIDRRRPEWHPSRPTLLPTGLPESENDDDDHSGRLIPGQTASTTSTTAIVSTETQTVSPTAPYSLISSQTKTLGLGPGPSSTAKSSTQYNGSSEPWREDFPPFRIALAAAIPIAFIAMGIILACIFRRKRKRRQERNQAMAELKFQPTRAGPPRLLHPTNPPQPPPSSLSPPPVPAAAPVVISPMAPGMGGAYFTGIDTSDVVSVVSHPLPPNGFAFDPEHGDEPPPPYRPRSVAPVSRETSVRLTEPVRGSRIQLTPPPEEQRTRSPFDDPEDGDSDALSVVSGSGDRLVRDREQEDRMSDVSDLSYQDPTTARHAV